MRLNLVSKRPAPEPPYDTVCVCVAPKLVPFIFQSLWLKSQKYWWETPEDWRTGRRLLAEQASNMLEDCNREVVHLLQAQYNLLDATFRGVEREVSGIGTEADPFIYDPPIPQTVAAVEGVEPSALYYLRRANEIAQNAYDGTAAADLPVSEGMRPLVLEIRDILLNADLSDDDTLALLAQILAAIGA